MLLCGLYAVSIHQVVDAMVASRYSYLLVNSRRSKQIPCCITCVSLIRAIGKKNIQTHEKKGEATVVLTSAS